MKKLLALLFVCLMIFSLIGCSVKEDDSSSKDEKSSSQADSNKEKDDGKYKRGISVANGWQSEYIGVKFTPDSNYIMATEEELEALMEQSGAVLEDAGMDSSKVDYAKIVSVYEFMAVKSNGSNILCMAEKLTLSNITEEQYVDALKAQMESIQYEVTFSELKEYKIGDVTFYKTESLMNSGSDVAKQMYLLKKMDDRMIVFILTENEDGDFEDMLGMLSAL